MFCFHCCERTMCNTIKKKEWQLFKQVISALLILYSSIVGNLNSSKISPYKEQIIV